MNKKRFLVLVTILITFATVFSKEVSATTLKKAELPVVKKHDYCKAYAEALIEGFKMSSEEAYLLMQEQEENIGEEPRLVIDESGNIHII